ncbi:MAG: K(+)-transporting ATPase subunit C [Syntrophales bacterium]|jgi:K+-transporting ATPase ATPase C chain|nr:K(+)-transporting ATPase subunit C [Syntrophales bacterium]MCK9392598.1 K(+)-transporting ATPase subunit C [Syntrophales bacterium]
MKTTEYLKELRTALASVLVLVVILCGAYPFAVWGIGQALFPNQANGSLIQLKGKMVGSSLIAQGFKGAAYFHPRPSAAGQGYDASSSGGSNLGPTSRKLIDSVTERIAVYRSENNLSPQSPVPADAVTSSGSGLDPHISVQNARLQAPRVAKARNMSQERLRQKIDTYTEGRDLGIFGEPRVNVLNLNLDLDYGR